VDFWVVESIGYVAKVMVVDGEGCGCLVEVLVAGDEECGCVVVAEGVGIGWMLHLV
jgi:N-acetylglutamate synthase/N-acetylornithine aminotransferase